MYKDYYASINSRGPTSYYVMKHQKRGRVVIINNEKFLQECDQVDGANIHYLKQRDGTSADKTRLNILFTQLGFEPIIHDNLTAKDMETIIDHESTFDHTHFDCHVLIILSHGDKGIVYGTDGYFIKTLSGVERMNYVTISSIRDRICNTQSLQGKPKLFFIQACRGSGTDLGVQVSSAACLEAGFEDMDINLQNAMDTFLDMGVRAEEADGGDIIPRGADWCMAMATVSGKVSWRNTDYGTWFIQAVIYIFSNHAHECDLSQLMVKVNALVSQGETRNKEKQISYVKNTFRKIFAFFPGLP